MDLLPSILLHGFNDCGTTPKYIVLSDAVPLTVTATGPDKAPCGTTVVRLVSVANVTVAFRPLNVTTFLAGLGLKPVPVITTLSPATPLEGSR